MHPRLFFATSLFAIFTFTCSQTFGDETLLVELRKQIKDTLSVARSELRKPVVAKTFVNQGPDIPLTERRPNFEFYATGNDMLCFRGTAAQLGRGQNKGNVELSENKASGMIPGDRKPGRTVAAKNSAYAFRLTEAANGQGWLMTEFGLAGSTEAITIEKELDIIRADTLEAVNNLSAIDGKIQLDTLFQCEGFTLTAATKAVETGAVQLKFTRSIRGMPGVTANCEYNFDPASRWLPIECRETISEKGMTRTFGLRRRITLGGGRYMVESEVSNNVSGTGKGSPDVRKAIYTVEPDAAPDLARFTLTAFGLPEPVGTRPNTTPWYMWLLGAAAGCLALAVLFRLLSRSRSR